MTSPRPQLDNGVMRDTVRCPKCKAPARVPCRTRAGVALDDGAIHEKRRTAYMAFRRGRRVERAYVYDGPRSGLPLDGLPPVVAPAVDDPGAFYGHPGDDPDDAGEAG